MGSFEVHMIIVAQKISEQEGRILWQKWAKLKKNDEIITSPTHLLFKLQKYNVPQKSQFFMEINGFKNEILIYIEKVEKKWNLPFWPIST